MDVTEFLRAVRYTEEEIENEKYRVSEAFDKCKIIDEEDLKKAQANLSRYLTTEGARRAFAIAVMRFTDMMMAKDEGKKLIYLIHEEFPQIGLTFYNAMGRDKLVIEIPETYLWLLFGQMCFDRMVDILEAAEKYGMEIGVAHCPIDQLAYGGVAGDIIPKPDVATSGGVFCDQGPKTAEIIGELCDVPYFVTTDACRDESWGSFPELDIDCIRFLGESTEKHFNEIGDHLGVEVTEKHFRKARVEIAMLWGPLQETLQLTADGDPRPISCMDEEPFLQMTVYPDWRTKELTKAFRTLIKEIKERTAKGEGVVPKGALRTTFFCDPRPDIAEMCEKELGLNILLPGIYWVAPFEKTRMIGKEENEYVRFAEAYIRRGIVRCHWDHVYRAIECTNHFKLDGYMAAYEYGCRPLCFPGRWIKDEIEEKLGIPATYFEESADPRIHTPDQLRTKIETFASVMKIKKAKREKQAA
ncbi:MAG: 2-hydroxyacyl-CoA dehydratase family protein [Desulfatiglans sp.]|jgi:hypothetical protein|nr:2-hydroxyacyl-CoA dehydratase family protein [Thermodesulfobacteriota bacterium]MEE4351238.1 2-hydroxyacyl-CoA dehydratase family protein [Desulfatiglans sp.]